MANGEFITLNISDYIENKIEGFGVAKLKRTISTFSSIDPRVESFLKKNAEEFARQHKSVTYLAFSSGMAKLVGYFTVAVKSITVDAKMISRTVERALKKTGSFDAEKNTYTAGVFLIGQLGKNFSPSARGGISGNELLQLALYRLKLIQHDVGGTIVFLEAQAEVSY